MLLWMALGVSTMTFNTSYAQEEQESAEVYLEEYTDEFQENFFEALKQKGIQNYDRAIDLLLKCKQLEPDNSVVDYELGKAYLLDKQYIKAQEYAIAALISEPTDFWYADNLLTILEQQGSPLETIQERIPYSNQKLKENFAIVYFKKSKYEEARRILKELGTSRLVTELTEKINDSLQKGQELAQAPAPKLQDEEGADPVSQLQATIQTLLAASDAGLLDAAKDALDNYPLQPYFYFAYGAALHRNGNSNKAIEVLESGLDYLLDDQQLANDMYRELSKAYTAIGNAQKANEYLNKINTGL